MASIPTIQDAWIIHGRGLPKDVVSIDKIPVPKLQPGQLLVKVQAAALNPLGYKVMGLAPNLFVKRPRIAEHDFTGLVEDPNGTSFKKGDLVYGEIHNFPKDGQGALAQYIAPREVEVAIRPAHLSVEEAAGLALAGLTAYQAVFDTANGQPGQHVFVNGGSSSVGSLAIQLLKAKGCKVSASCSGKNIELVKKLGADEVFDYTIKPLHKQLVEAATNPKYSAVIDAVGSFELYTKSGPYLASGSLFVALGSPINGAGDLPSAIYHLCNAFLRPTWLGGAKAKFKFCVMDITKERMASLTELVKQAEIKPTVDSVYEWNDVQKAYERIMTKRATGKVVVRVP